MRHLVPVFLTVVGASALALAAGTASPDAPLEAGSDAPAFSLIGSDGKTHRLKDHVGSRAVVIAWFPKAFTGG